MARRLRTRQKKTSIATPDYSTAPQTSGMFQSRPFVVQTQTAQKSQQPDLKTSLMRAQRYGHRLDKMRPVGATDPKAVQPKQRMGHLVGSDRAMPQVLKAKLSVGAPGDTYEQGADAVAAQVVDRIHGRGDQAAQESAPSQPIQQRQKKKSSQPKGLNIQPLVQRESAEGVQEFHSNSGGKNPIQQIKDSNAPVQLADYTSPGDPAISATMSAASITNFGPYIWDSDVPRFKLNNAYTTWTIADCVNSAIYEPETNAVSGEKSKKQGLINMRRTAAMRAVFGATKGVAEKIMQQNNGTAPRAFANLATEDTYSVGHSNERHILGNGLMTGHRQVALRAAFWKVNGVRMDLDAAGTATVFANQTTATTAVTTALNNELVANWATHRADLARGKQVKINSPVSVSCVAYTKRDAPPGSPYPDTEMPKYIDNTKSGDRELYPGDYVGPGQPSDANAPDPTKQSLTTGGSVVYNHVYVIVDPNPSAPGGWAIYTAYPKP